MQDVGEGKRKEKSQEKKQLEWQHFRENAASLSRGLFWSLSQTILHTIVIAIRCPVFSVHPYSRPLPDVTGCAV